MKLVRIISRLHNFVSTAALPIALLLLAACTGGSGSPGDGQCGNNAIEGTETCDGDDHGGLSCESLGLGTGTLACEPNCSQFDTSGCEDGCQKDCTGRVCGPDPVCGFSCGECDPGACNTEGQCESGDPNGPVILSFSTNVDSITEGESITFTAVVTDPDGIDDLIGGTLSAPSGDAFGPFATAAQEGAYSATVSWSQLDQVETIEFENEATTTFVATFFDTSGHSTTATKSITLHCDGIAACDGVCTDLRESRDNCGACGNQIASHLICNEGAPSCPTPGQVDCGTACFDLLDSDTNCGACGNDCTAILPEPPGYKRHCYVGKCGFTTNNGAWNDWGYVMKSCSEYCANQDSTCGELDWNAWALHEESDWLPETCGTGAGCFFYDYALENPACVDPLPCGTVPSQKQDCSDLYTTICFCN